MTSAAGPSQLELGARPTRALLPRLVRVLASLRLTVWLLALSMVLVFVGTIAQTRLGVWQVVDTYFRAPVAWIDPGLFFPVGGSMSALRIPLPGGLLLGSALLVNLLAAHVARFRATRRKVGVMVIHAGLVVLLAGEFATGLLADEGLLRIDEGGWARATEDVRRVELAVLDPSDPEMDRVVTIPGAMLADAVRGGGPIRDPRLPFEITVERWMGNAELWRGGATAGATAGVGLEAVAREIPASAGADGAVADMPAALVTLRTEGRTLGSWLIWAGLEAWQPVATEPGTRGLSLRFARTYLPFEVHLLDFRHDTFVGTTIPRNFSSDVRLVDPERGVDRPVRIWMNNPLRYRGLAFYQASYKPDGSGTVLQVVRNPGRLLPYAACGLVGLGLLWHFGSSLRAFMARQRAHQPDLSPQRGRSAAGRRRAERLLLAAGVALGVVVAGAGLMRPSPADRAGLRTFASLPVSAGGRIKPMDTSARSLLMVVGGRASVQTEAGTLDAAAFLLELIARPESVRNVPVVRVDDPGVRSLLGLPPEGGSRISLASIEPHWPEITAQASRAHAVPERARDGFQRGVLQLHDRVNLLLAHAQMREPYVVPPLGPGEQWRSFHDAFIAGVDAAAAAGPDAEPPPPHPAVAYYTAMMTAASEGDGESFDRAIAAFDDLLGRDLPESRARARLEVMFNRAAPFRGAMAVYALAVLALLASFLLHAVGGTRAGLRAGECRAAASGLLWSAIVAHTLAIALRMYLQDRPPVTNLYSSAVFVGWAAVLIGLFVERVFPAGLAALGAGGIGVCTLIVAHNLGNDGDTMQMMQAVLDSNFWLATHVVAITLGYSATFLAGVLGALQILLAATSSRPAADRSRMLARMTYGVACFALLLSFVGTVLGGIWADQSWGRFWGWDPKENGAALVVLIHAVIIHARWGGMVRDRGVAVLAVGGNIVTAWSWFGTNMLGTGLHSYGFMDSAAMWLGVFVMSQVALMVLGMWQANGGASAPRPLPTGDRRPPA